MEEKPKKDTSFDWIWQLLMFILIIYVLGSCGGNSHSPSYPYDSSVQEDADLAAEIREGQLEIAQSENNPCLQDAELGVPEEYQRCDGTQISHNDLPTPVPTKVIDNTICPQGCQYRKLGCDIKGDILKTGEKIYYLPGDELYDSVVVDHLEGDRWFCSEREAIINNWIGHQNSGANDGR